MRVAEEELIGNNGCYFERGFSQRGGARKSVDKAAISLPHAAKKEVLIAVMSQHEKITAGA
ncbi:MAG: hypothetical protein WB581_01355 [Halobacteriota archaeon]